MIEQIDGIVPSIYGCLCGQEPGVDTDKLTIFFHTPFSEGVELIELIKQIRKIVQANVGIYPSYVLPVEKETYPRQRFKRYSVPNLLDSSKEGVFRETQKRVELLTAGANTLPNWFFKPAWRPRH